MNLRAAPLRCERLTCADLIMAGFVFSAAANWPGHLSYDSVIQLPGRPDRHIRQLASAGHVLAARIWVMLLWPGAGLFVLFDALLLFGSLLALVLLFPPRGWRARGPALLVVARPRNS